MKRKIIEKTYTTVGVRFLCGASLHKIYTYRVPRRAKLHLGQELVVPSPQGSAIAVVVAIHTTPQDTGPYDYKFVTGKVAKL